MLLINLTTAVLLVGSVFWEMESERRNLTFSPVGRTLWNWHHVPVREHASVLHGNVCRWLYL